MSRWDSSTNATEAAGASVVIAVLVDLDFASGHVRAHDGLGTLSHGGNDYYGVGQFGGIELDAEDQDVAARGARLTLSGIPADLTPDVLTQSNYQGRAATLYISLLNKDTNAWIDTPEVLWDGYMDFLDLQIEGGNARVVLHVEDELRREPLQAWYTDEDQQLRHSGDRFFSDLPNVEIYQAAWGVKPAQFRGNAFRRLGRAVRAGVQAAT